MKYRPEIDGLRALAVIPVILFHGGSNIFSGGFLGVDIFFVISGYLITGIILEELSQGRFSLKHFYARRARRILPALFCVILVCIPFAWVWMLPSQYQDFSRSLLAVIGFVSNIFFWQQSGYFAAAAEEKPLLHTWSLAVEEQFYLLFPLVLWLVWKYGKRQTYLWVGLAALASLMLSEYASRYHVNANFFLLPTRAWELMIGALCALVHHQTPTQKNNVAASLGLGFVVVALITYNESMRLPSLYSALPVVGTALMLLYATQRTWVAKLLSVRIMVGIGLISYSAYLWHQPLFAFTRIRTYQEISPFMVLGLTLLSLALAAITWKYVEQPFRNKQHSRYVPNRRALPLALVTAFLLLAAGAHGGFTSQHQSHWEKHATPQQIRAYQLLEEAKQQPAYHDNDDCVFRIKSLTSEVESRLLSCHKKYGKGLAILGDSHAMDLYYMLESQLEHRKFVADFSQGKCRAHSPLPICVYDKFPHLIKNNSALFDTIIYEQAGSHLLLDSHQREIDSSFFSGLPLNSAVPDLAFNGPYIDTVIAYLLPFTKHSKVIWLGPRIEPQINENAVIQFGCDYPFMLRQNQAETFQQLDRAIQSKLYDMPIVYYSQIDMIKFDMAKDFISCDRTYFMDGDHYSPEGERSFGQRIPSTFLAP